MPDFNDIVFSEEEEELHLSPAEVRFFKKLEKVGVKFEKLLEKKLKIMREKIEKK